MYLFLSLFFYPPRLFQPHQLLERWEYWIWTWIFKMKAKIVQTSIPLSIFMIGQIWIKCDFYSFSFFFKDKITLFIHNYEEYHEDDVETFLEEFKSKYRAVEIIHAKEGVKEWHARNKGITKCRQLKCDYYFSVDSDAFIDNTLTLKLLIEQNRDVIAPFLIRPYKAWSNFWGALTSEGKILTFFTYLLSLLII